MHQGMFFGLVFVSFLTEFGVVARALNLHEQRFFFSNVLPDCSQQPSWVSRMRQHVANGARDCRPWHKFVSRPFLPKR